MLSNAEREKLVLDLYNQVKNIRHLPKEARISFRDINTLFKESGRQPQSENSKKQSVDNSSGSDRGRTQGYAIVQTIIRRKEADKNRSIALGRN